MVSSTKGNGHLPSIRRTYEWNERVNSAGADALEAAGGDVGGEGLAGGGPDAASPGEGAAQEDDGATANGDGQGYEGQGRETVDDHGRCRQQRHLPCRRPVREPVHHVAQGPARKSPSRLPRLSCRVSLTRTT